MHTQSTNKKRIMTLIGTVITQFALGSVYTWSLFNAQLAGKLGEPISRVAFTFGILTLALAVASSLSGKVQERFGIRKSTIGAGLLLGVSFFLTAHSSSLIMLYLCAGVLVGLADGTGYLMTLSNCVKWFPEKKGLISACSIGAYGLGSLGFKFINAELLNHVGLDSAFTIWGILAMVLVIIGGFLVYDAPKQETTNSAHSERDYTLQEVLRLPQYWMLALIFLTCCMSGLYVIGVAKDIGENYVHLSSSLAANSVAVIAVANLLGRLVLGVLSDKMPRLRVISLALAVSLFGIALLIFVPLNAPLFYVSIACLAFSFGGSITVFPSLISDFFGLNNLTKNYGLIYLGFGIGSFVGSIVASVFGGFAATFYLILALLIVSMVISTLIKLPESVCQNDLPKAQFA